jgi:uncharacterized glyoxalase superfamily protein PhnB
MSIEQITPKLSIEGADKAIRYYSEVLAAVLRDRHAADGRVLFAELALPCGATLQLKDADEFDPDPLRLGGRGVLLTVVTDDPDDLARRMVAAGGETVFEVADQYYGARQGRVRDPFGHEWIIGTPVPRAAEFAAGPVDEEPG